MLEIKIFEITEFEAGQRVDNFIFKKFRHLPKTLIYRKLRKGEIRVNKKRTKPDYKLKTSDSVRTALPKSNSTATTTKPSENLVKLLSSRIIADTDSYLVINKPANYAVHGGSGINIGIIEALRVVFANDKLELAHRLDKGTSGCLVIAKKMSFLRAFHEQLRLKNIQKKYVALTKNAGLPDTMQVNTPLKRVVLPNGETIVRCSADGKSAATNLTVLQRYTNATLLQAEPVTGRTHQIRVHCQNLAANIAGDLKYKDDDFNAFISSKGGNRMFLHAKSIKCKIDDKEFKYYARLDEDFEQVLEKVSEQ